MKMNAETRQHKDRFIHSNQLFPKRSVFFYNQTPCHGKRPVKPGMQNSAAIDFHIDFDVTVRRDTAWTRLNLETGGIRMRPYNPKSLF